MTAVRAASTAADGGNDFQAVAILQHAGGELAARHDFAVALHGHAFAGKLQFPDQFGAAEDPRQGACFAIDGD